MRMFTTYEDYYDSERDSDHRIYGEDHEIVECLTRGTTTIGLETLREYHRPVSENPASMKQLIFKTEPELDLEKWREKPRNQWTEEDVLHWIADVATSHKFSVEAVNASAFKVDGRTLLNFSQNDFKMRDHAYGDYLFSALHTFPIDPAKKDPELENLGYTTLIPRGPSGDESLFMSTEVSNDDSYFNMDQQNLSEERDSESEVSEPEEKPEEKPKKRPPGRPPGTKSKTKPKKTGRLWEFIRDLLLDPQYCPSVICWENHDDGVFRFVKSEKVAKIWGNRKGNDKMNYEKLSRAMRYYYKSKVLQPVLGRKLVYKFGPTARGWRSDNPNFRH